MSTINLLSLEIDALKVSRVVNVVEPIVHTDEKLLLLSIAASDRAAFNQLVTLKWNNIYAQALTYVKSSHTAQDIVQDVFLKIWENRHKLSEIERFDNYLFIVARNCIISELRKKVALPLNIVATESLEEAFREPDKILHQSQLASIISKGIQLLPPQQKLAFKLSRDEGLSYEEIAQKMSLSRETVKKHICKSLNFLRTYIRVHSELIMALLVAFLN